jgi:hypothetical protein
MVELSTNNKPGKSIAPLIKRMSTRLRNLWAAIFMFLELGQSIVYIDCTLGIKYMAATEVGSQ